MNTSAGLPVTLSQSVPAQSVSRAIATQPLTVYPVAGGFSLLAGAFAFSSEFFLLASFLSLFVGAANYIVNVFFRRQVWVRRFQERSLELERLRLMNRPQHIKDEFLRLGCERGVQQVERLGDARNNLLAMIREQLVQGELAFERSFALSQEVYEASLDVLEGVIRKLQSVSYIDQSLTIRRVRELQQSDPLGFEMEVMKERVEMVDRIMKEVEEDFLQNEQSVNALNETMSNLARIETHAGCASMPLDDALAALQEMAGSIHLYDRNNDEARRGSL